MNSKKNLLAATVAFFMGSGAAVVSAADQNQVEELNQRGIDEIIVTAQKREQRLIDVPISISVLGEDDLKDSHIKDMADLAYVVPNLTITKQAGGMQRISLRGIGNVEGTSVLVGIYLDETPLSLHPAIQAGLQTIDLERVEVLKGPQGTLYGQGSSGGTIRFITKKPSFEGFHGELGGTAYTTKDGSASQEITAIANLPVVDDTLAFRIAATYKDIGGWIDHPDINKEDANDTELSNVRVKGLWQVSDPLSIEMTATRSRENAGALSQTNFGPTSDSNYRTVVRNGFDLPSTDVDHQADIYNLTLNYDFGFATLTSSTSDMSVTNDISSLSFNILQDLDINSGGYNIGDANELDGFAQEIRLTSNESDNWDWTVGAFYTDTEDLHTIASGGSSTDGVGVVFFTNLTVAESSETTSLFANVGYHFSEQLTLSIGTRYFEDERTFSIPLFGISEADTFDNLSSTASLSYAVADQANIYFSVAEGYRSGGFNWFSSITFEPETVTTYELGAKAALFNGRMTAEGALYHSEYSNYQGLSFDGDLTSIFTLNPGEAEIQGIELSTQISITEGLTLGLSGNYTDTEFTKTSLTVPIYNQGDSITGIPKYSYSLNTRYNFNWSSSVSGFAYIEYNRQAGAYNTDRRRSTQVRKSSPIGQLNAKVGAEWEDFNVNLFARNLTNDMRGTIATPVLGALDSQNRPRTLGVEFTYAF